MAGQTSTSWSGGVNTALTLALIIKCEQGGAGSLEEAWASHQERKSLTEKAGCTF